MTVPIHNPTPNIRYLLGVAIPPGETRVFDKRSLPRHLWTEPRAVDPVAPEPTVLDLLEGNARAVSTAIIDLPEADLNTLIAAETAGKGRKTVISALQKALLERAAEAVEPAIFDSISKMPELLERAAEAVEPAAPGPVEGNA